jgi:TATA-binding protein-associated factor Taf7
VDADMSNFTMRERDMYHSLKTGRIPESCKLDQFGIKVENEKIVTPGVILRFQPDDIRHIKVFLDNQHVGNIFYKEERGMVPFILTNINK